MKIGQVTGFFNDAKIFFDDTSIKSRVVEIHCDPMLDDNLDEIRGSFIIDIPKYKRIQIEFSYDLLLDNLIYDNSDDYHVEIFEKNRLNNDEWIQTDIIKKPKELWPKNQNIFESSYEKYSHHSYVANLSEWAGKQIRLDIVSKISNEATNGCRGRWTKLNLIGSTFNFDFVKKNTTKINTTQSMKIAPKFYPDLPSIDGDFTLNGYGTDLMYSYPDTGPAPVYINNRWVSYFNASIPGSNFYTGGEANSGSLMFDMSNYSSYDFYTITPSLLPNCLLRVVNSVITPNASSSYEPYPAIKPYRPANPSNDLSWKDNWDNGYTGVNSAFVATDSGYTRVHAFLHVEDWFDNADDPNFDTSLLAGFNYPNGGGNAPYTYARIGYARSPHNQPYDLELTDCSSDVSSASINNASPIIQCFQSEGEQTQNLGLCGAASPSVIIDDNKIYLFYTRNVQWNWVRYETFYTNETLRNKLGGKPALYNRTISVAKADYDDIVDENYSSNVSSSPWKKYYDGNWNENGIGGLSASLVNDIDDQYESRVLCNVMYNSYLDQYLMLAWNDFNKEAFLYTCDDLDNPIWGTGIQIDLLPSDEMASRLVGSSGDDKLGGRDMKLYTRDYTTTPPTIIRYSMRLY